MFDYMTVEEAAVSWDVTIQYVRNLCRKGEVPGALKKGTMWFIPSDTEHPMKMKKRLYQFSGTKKKIFEVSLKLFAQRSFDSITLKDIADKAGIAQSAVYRHFQSKQEILETIYGYFRYYYLSDRPNVEDVESVIQNGSVKEILNCVYYDFSAGSNMLDCLKIIFQRMSTDEKAGETFRTFILGHGLDFSERVFTRAIALGRLPDVDPYALSVYSNMVRQSLLLIWLANAEQEMHEKFMESQDVLLDWIVRSLTAMDGRDGDGNSEQEAQRNP